MPTRRSMMQEKRDVKFIPGYAVTNFHMSKEKEISASVGSTFMLHLYSISFLR